MDYLLQHASKLRSPDYLAQCTARFSNETTEMSDGPEMAGLKNQPIGNFMTENSKLSMSIFANQWKFAETSCMQIFPILQYPRICFEIGIPNEYPLELIFKMEIRKRSPGLF